MSNLAGLIKKIRKRSKTTQAEFARRLGVAQSSVSMYEKGKLVPSDPVLILLASQAENEGEKASIAAHLQGTGELHDGFVLNPGPIQAELRDLRRIVGGRNSNLIALGDYTLRFLREGTDVPSWLVDVIALWDRYSDRHELWPIFQSLPQQIKGNLLWQETTGEITGKKIVDEDVLLVKRIDEVLASSKRHLLVGMIEALHLGLDAERQKSSEHQKHRRPTTLPRGAGETD